MGQHEYGLKSLADDQLLAGLARIVHRRNQITTEFLAYLAELDERQLSLDHGFSSLFEYCVKTLKLCESTAGRHIAAARVCRKHPEAFALVASGALHASALSLLKKHLTPENAAELFDLCTHRSARKVEELLAARFPRPDVRDSVRRLPVRSHFTLDVGCAAEQVGGVGAKVDGARAHIAASARTVSVELTSPADATPTPSSELAKASPESRTGDLGAAGSMEASRSERVESFSLGQPSVEPHDERRLTPWCGPRSSPESSKPRRFEPLSEDRYGVHFTADGEFCALLERVRGLAGHRLPSGDLMTLLKSGLEAYERELEKRRFAVGGKRRRGRSGVPASDSLSASNAPKPDRSARDSSTGDSSTGDSSTGDSASATSPSALFTRSPSASASRVKQNPGRKRKRYCPAAVVRAVFLRDEKQCTYVSPDGRRCSACRFLELDHIEPFAVGGEATVGNLRLRCRAHNQRYARQYFGRSQVNTAIQASKKPRATAAQPEC